MNWISVKDRLPEPRIDILLLINTDEKSYCIQGCCHYDLDEIDDLEENPLTNEDVIFSYTMPNVEIIEDDLTLLLKDVNANLSPGDVTHWMPLPEAP